MALIRWEPARKIAALQGDIEVAVGERTAAIEGATG